MWIWKADYDFLRQKADAEIAVTIERNMLQNLVFRLEAEVTALKAEKDQERHRAEAALDEMVKFSTAIVGYMPRGVAEKSPERHDPEKMDNLFDEEDTDAAKAVATRIAEDPSVLFDEYHGTND